MKLIFGQHDKATLQQIDAVLASGAEYFVDARMDTSATLTRSAAWRPTGTTSPSPALGSTSAAGTRLSEPTSRASRSGPKIIGIMDEVFDKISFGVGRKRGVDMEYLDATRRVVDGWIDVGPPIVKQLRTLAHDQIGTVGSGNHYVDIFVEEATDEVWVGVHFGSRGFGHKIATHFMREVGAKDGMMSPPALLDVDSEMGCDYIQAMNIAGLYAKLGRDLVVDTVCKILGGACTAYVNNHHNFAWKETHFGEKFWSSARAPRRPSQPARLHWRLDG